MENLHVWLAIVVGIASVCAASTMMGMFTKNQFLVDGRVSSVSTM